MGVHMRINIRSFHKRTLLAALLIGTCASLSALLANPAKAGVEGWDAGNIMSDFVFTNKHTMNAGDIQAFLNSKVSSCDTWGTQPSEFGGGTRRQWAEARGYSPPYTCLRDYSQDGRSAAQIIYDTAQEFSINPQVLLVLLQKEQSLVTDTWPLSIQYRSATGYGCPDTAPCDAEYYGFTNQVRWAARMFRAIMNNSPTWYTPYVLGNNYIRYSPDSSCGGSNVYIQNRATQALYNYTPYQPNQAALDAGWGTAHCGAYGNRNFYLYFTSWFGGTRGINFTSLDNPRWMRLKQATQKTNLTTGQKMTDNTLAMHQQIRFVDKIQLNGTWYLRTEFDRNAGNLQGIPQNDVEEIPYENLATPVWKTLVQNGNKSFPSSRKYAEPLPAGTSIKFTQKINIGNVTYYRTEHDASVGNELGVITSQLSDFQLIPLSVPTYMRTNAPANKVDVLTQSVQSTVPAGTDLKIERKTRINGVWYYQELADATSGNRIAIDSTKISRNEKVALKKEITIAIPQSMHKTNLHNLSNVTDNPLNAGQKITVSHSVMVNGTLYYVTKFDAQNGNHQGVKVSDLFMALDVPRTYTAVNDTNKIKLSDLSMGASIPKDQTIFFSTKLSIDGNWCLRSQADTDANNLLCVPVSSLK